MAGSHLPDYLPIAPDRPPSFYNSIDGGFGSVDQAKKSRLKGNGYPIPGVQSPSATSVMTKDYFVSDTDWQTMLDHGSFDYIVVGSGFTALAFIDEALKLNPDCKILVLERGGFWLPTHFQNLPLPFKMVLGGPSETFPWTLSRKTHKTRELQFCHGSCPFFGGRSTFWSAWCPQPPIELMRGYPRSLTDATEERCFWAKAKELLHVTPANEIGDTIFDELQTKIDNTLEKNLNKISTANYVESAPLAVGHRSPTSTLRFDKFSVPGPMLALSEDQRIAATQRNGSPLELMNNCVVKKMSMEDDGYVRILETSKGVLNWDDKNTKVILCAGSIPNATLLLNSFEGCEETVGKRLTGHFLTHIAARCPVSAVPGYTPGKTLEIGATYLAGQHTNGKQYHIQITAIHSPNPEDDVDDAARECPDYAASATYDQLKDSKDHIVFICATLGEFSEDNKDNWIKKNKTRDITSNVNLQFTVSPDDKALWDTMDTATYQAIQVMSNQPVTDNGLGQGIEYWDTNTNSWKAQKPAVDTIRVPGAVHESSTAFVGEKSKGGSLDDMYRPHGVKNVHVTGGAVFPTAGSWNPTLTMCGFAQDLARKLHKEQSARVRRH
ncbi:hypothetical protein ASPWEDRAFT_50365 [Aspergillus wentii DTO 134E9]|uniref:Glucose-methanol-choline oxidoreductase C-terminal domain-containing protein n=1 Tax=Aspergillus wentii DTO 134E9 TaxID=1073089 RepID=A0A1L9RQ83_ASPWE|nr:uncharacterized protein ASPWEDRAFT_50365 [Aspergillus wentii DTO 134E9]OJJ37023.1 hypothetical protein ASPWEDRAFT_50365 [Aspergillus wentii DTO 134E9]